MKKHKLKTWPLYFIAVWEGSKKFEVRKNDRNFEVGDYLILREYNPNTDKYSGREVLVIVTYMMGGGVLDLPREVCVMSIDFIHRNENGGISSTVASGTGE